MANQQGGAGDYAHVFSFGISSPHNNLNIPHHPPPPVVYHNNPISTPPLSAIDRFLASDHDINNTTRASQYTNILNFEQNYLEEVPYVSYNIFHQNGPSGPNNNLSRHGDHVSNNQHQGTNYDFFMTESQIRNWEKSVGDVINGDEEMRRKTSNQNQKKRSRVRGTGNSSNNIKGQWTADEDRKLLSLMRQHGDKKWSQIADEMYRRSGKQCRERWQNHLRPDIKKDGWSEVEEKLLIEAHQRLGNRWAEIARRIPGRSENSIKNHWNATKRRQFTKRKNRIDNEAASKNCILHDYIKDKIMKAANQTSNINLDLPSTNFGIPSFPQSASADSEPTYDDDINNLWQSLFGSNDNNYNNSPNLVDELGQLLNDNNPHSSSNSVENGTMMMTAADQQNVQVEGNFSNEIVAQLQPMNASGVADLLDEVYSTPYLDYCYDGTPCIDKVYQQQQQQPQQPQQLMNHQAEASSSSGPQEMDLLDLVLANFHYPE